MNLTKDRILSILFDLLILLIMLLVIVVCLYPLVYVLSMSISDPLAAARREVWLLPKGFSVSSYQIIFENQQVWRSYYNTIYYTVFGTIINVVMTIILAYPLSRRNFFLRNPISIMVTFTMFFGGGLVPSFILINQLGLYNTRWAILIPSAISAYNMIIAKTFFQSIPESLVESAKLDGASDLRILFSIVFPLSMPIISVLVLYYAVGHWNSYFPALLYLNDADLQPLQLYLRRILIENTGELSGDMAISVDKSLAAMQLKYSIIIVSTLPILCIYPFLQKYFVKGVMIGAIK